MEMIDIADPKPAVMFGEAYYMNGKTTGISNYENYRWLPDHTLAWAHTFVRLLGIREGQRILDVGCALGTYVRALRMLGFDAYGYDISHWAVNNADAEVKPYLSSHLNGAKYDLIFSKDCMEHVPEDDLRTLVKHLLGHTNRLFIIVPLAKDGEYVHPKEENDVTHVNRWALEEWLSFVSSCSPAFVHTASYMYPGLKPGAYEVEHGYGFLLSQRI